jgi:hypothetical protein
MEVRMKRLLIALFCIGLLLCGSNATADTISLGFDSLPSAQGWRFLSSTWSGSGYCDPDESAAFSVDGAKLEMNTMGLGFCGYDYRYDNIVDMTEPYTVSTTARVLQYESLDGSAGGAFHFGAIAETNSCVFALSTTGVHYYGALLFHFDTTHFHNYRIVATPGVGYKLYIDNIEMASGSFYNEPGLNQLVLGNATSYENALAEVTEFSFTQGASQEACESITGNACVDNTCCVENGMYQDPYGLLNHGMYVSCVADAAKNCGLTGSDRGEIISRAAKSTVNQ